MSFTECWWKGSPRGPVGSRRSRVAFPVVEKLIDPDIQEIELHSRAQVILKECLSRESPLFQCVEEFTSHREGDEHQVLVQTAYLQ